MKALHTPHLIPFKNILPLNITIHTPQYILVNTSLQPTPKASRSPFSLPRNLQLHSTSNRLGDSECTTQSFHLQRGLGFFPELEARFEGVGGVGGAGGGGAGGGCEGGTDAAAEGVVEAGGGGRAGVL